MKQRIVGSAIFTAALLLFAAAPASAQRTAVHQGYWISFGFGAGSAFGDDAFDGDSKFGGAGFLRMGGSPSQQLLIGGEMIGWGTEQDDVQIGRGALMFTALYYPSPKGGFYLKGGAGFAGRSAERTIIVAGSEATIKEDDQAGIGLGAGLGYDIHRRWTSCTRAPRVTEPACCCSRSGRPGTRKAAEGLQPSRSGRWSRSSRRPDRARIVIVS